MTIRWESEMGCLRDGLDREDIQPVIDAVNVFIRRMKDRGVRSVVAFDVLRELFRNAEILK